MADNLNVNSNKTEYDIAEEFTKDFGGEELTIMKTEIKEELFDFEETVNDFEYVNVNDEYIVSPEMFFEEEKFGLTKSTEHISNENYDVGSCEIRTYLENNKYRCQLCHCDFEEEVHFRNHYEQCFLLADKKVFENNDADEIYGCKLCKFSTHVIELFLNHIRMHKEGTSTLEKQSAKPKRYKCTDCNYKTHNKYNLERHIRVHTNDRPFKCTYKDCKCTPEQKESCECSVCYFATKNNGNLIKHVLVKHSAEPKKYKCSYCKYDTYIKANLVRHIRIMHTNDKPFKCTYKNCKCTPEQEESCECDTCEYTTTTNNSLKTHIWNKHDTNPKPYKCKDCDYDTHTKRNLVSHYRVHTREKPFKCTYKNCKCTPEQEESCECDTCEYGTTTNNSLETHILNKHNTDPKPYKCKDCDYNTHTKRNLVSHYRLHTAEKPFKCTYKNCKCTPAQKKSCECNTCGHACPSSYRLKQHILAKHSTEPKRFKCKDCNYATHRKPCLVIHSRSHTGGKPFKCTYKNCKCIPGQEEEPCGCTMCEYATTCNSNLKRHIMKKHSPKPKKEDCTN